MREHHINIKKKYRERRSLKNRIFFMINLSTLFTVTIMSFMFLFFLNRMVFIIGTSTSKYYVEQIQTVVSTTLENNNKYNLSPIDFQQNKMFQDEMGRLSNMMPVFSINMEINGEIVYDRNAETFFQNYLGIGISKYFNNKSFEFDKANFNGTKVTGTLKDNYGNTIGSVRVGIDTKIEWLIYMCIFFALALGGFIVLIIMKIVTSIMVQPILKPLNELQKQMEELADENYENVNPILVVDEKTVYEVNNLANVTNRLLDKIVGYNEVIIQSEKMASVGQLTAAITHEINTPLGAINSNVNMIKLLAQEASTIDNVEDLLDVNENIKESAELSEEACGRIQEIIKSLRSFSRIDQANFMPADINESIRTVITLTTNLHKNRIHIEEKLGHIPKVLCYIGLINQVFMNLIINAIQAINGKGTITIETKSDDAFVYARISDTGCGISEKNINRIFEYGFTTKQPGSGSGIGLALSKNIVKKHNGAILVDSQEGKGTTITVKIPINQEKADE
jgi:signal transduction histidine kinase